MTYNLPDRILLWLLRQTCDAREAGMPAPSARGGRAARVADARIRHEAAEALAGWFPTPSMGCASKTTQRALRRLTEQGLVESSGATRARRWRLTEAGTAAADALVRAMEAKP